MEIETPNHLIQYPDGVRQVDDDQDRYLYLQKWLEMFRPLGYATRDNSWGELEKILDIVHRNYLQFQRQDIVQRKAKLMAEATKLEADLQAMDATLSAYGYDRHHQEESR